MASTTLMTTKDGRRFFKISVSRGYGRSPYTTRWYWPDGWSKKAAERELKKVAAEFEIRCNAGEILSRKEVKDKAAQEAAEAAKILTLKQYAEQIFMPTKKNECSENTRSYYENTLRKHIYPRFADARMTEITTDEIKALLLQKQESGLSQSSVTAIYITLGQMFKMAYESDKITRNPMDKVKKPKRNKAEEKDKSIASFSVDEMRYIFECLDNAPCKWKSFIYLLADTGMRRGEACGLRWQAVNFKDNTIEINNNLCYTPSAGIYEDTPKTEQSKRIVDVDPAIMDMLRELKAEQQERRNSSKVIDLSATQSDFVFTQDDGIKPMHPQSPTRYFKRFGERYGIQDFHPHKLRHSFASIAITNGADVASVSEKLGHANKGITLKMYTHADQESMKRASNIFRNALKAQA